jgi:hypothetical protein
MTIIRERGSRPFHTCFALVDRSRGIRKPGGDHMPSVQ